jgi:DNA polymerase III delta subunit
MGKIRLKPFIVVYGSEDFLLDRDLEKARSLKRSITLLDGTGLTDFELVSACEAQAFEGRARAVIIDNAHKVKGSKALEAYIASKDSEDSSVILFAVVRSDRLPAVWSKAASKGSSIKHGKFKPWEEVKKAGRVTDEAKRLKLKLDVGVSALFIKILGDDLRQIVNELRKLIHIVGEGCTVKKEHIALVLTPTYPAEFWGVAEAAIDKRPRRAMTRLSFLYKRLGDSALIPVVASLMRQVEKMVVARHMLDKGEDHLVIAERLGVKASTPSKTEFVFHKNILPFAQKHTVPALLSYMQNLCRLESQIKGSARSKRTLVELAVLAIAAA